MAKAKIDSQQELIRKDLIDQLECNGTVGAYYRDLVEDYMRYWSIRRELQDDIKKRGAKVDKYDSQGQRQIVNNNSIDQLLKVHSSMLKILDSLGIHPVDAESTSGVDEDDL